jgi:hypothetical protein
MAAPDISGITYSDTAGDAPLPVHVDCSSVVCDGVDNPFEDLLFFIDWGEDTSFTNGASGADGRKSWNPEAGHAYNTPGSYTVTIKVWNRSTNEVSTPHTQTITVGTFDGTKYYIDPTLGDDVLGDGSEVTPWQTYAKIESERSDDTAFYIKAGETLAAPAAGINLGNAAFWDGTPAQPTATTPLIIGRYDAGADPIIEGHAAPSGNGVIFCNKAEHVRVVNVKLDGNAGGDTCINAHDDLLLYDCELDDGYYGLSVGYEHNVMAYDCLIQDMQHYCVYADHAGAGGGGQAYYPSVGLALVGCTLDDSGIATNHSTARLWVSDSVIQWCHLDGWAEGQGSAAAGIKCHGSSAGAVQGEYNCIVDNTFGNTGVGPFIWVGPQAPQYAEECHHLLVERNVGTLPATGTFIQGRGGRYVTVRDNVVKECQNFASFAQYGVGAIKSYYWKFRNNSIYSTSATFRFIFIAASADGMGFTGFEWKSNLMTAPNSSGFAIEDLSDDMNINLVSSADNQYGLNDPDWIAYIGQSYYSLAGLQELNPAQEVGSSEEAPAYTDGPNGDLTLTSEAPAIDTGTDFGLGVDALTAKRTYGELWDKGAYEYGAPTWEPLEPEIDVDTSPVNFGNIITTESSDEYTWTINNTGDEDLTVSGITVLDATDFAVTTGAAGMTIAAGESDTCGVTFTPTGAGLKSTTLRIASDDTDEANTDVAITGTGVAASGGSSNVTQSGMRGLVDQLAVMTSYTERSRRDDMAQVRVYGVAGERHVLDYVTVSYSATPTRALPPRVLWYGYVNGVVVTQEVALVTSGPHHFRFPKPVQYDENTEMGAILTGGGTGIYGNLNIGVR